jgi:YD repeat-containing protein
MKIRLLFAFIALSLASCSSDDSSTGKEPSDNREKKLREIVQTEFNDNGSVKQTAKIQFDDYERALVRFGYDGTGELISKEDYTYNSAGMLETLSTYTVENGAATHDYAYTLAYDSNGRVISRTETGGVSATTAYTYNENNTITEIRTAGSTSFYATYYLNAEGQLYKRTSETDTEQLTYTGKNIGKYSNNTFTSVFAYDSALTPKGQQHNVVVNIFKGNMVNALLVQGLFSITMGSTQYVAKRTDNADVFDYEYEFDGEGYPVKIRCFKNEASVPFSIREVHYK